MLSQPKIAEAVPDDINRRWRHFIHQTTEMLCSSNHHSLSHCHPCLRRVSAVHHPLMVVSLSSSSPQKPPPPPPPAAATDTPKTLTAAKTPRHPNPILRTQNSKSSSLLLTTLSLPSHPRNDDVLVVSEEEKARILELSLVRKRPPQFPGSIYASAPHENYPSTAPLSTLLGEDGDDQEMLRRAIEIRRKVTLEIFVDAMVHKGKFGITYSRNLGSKLGEFIDLVMIEAADMKRVPEFSRLSFNARARKFIQESNVIPLIRWLKHNALSYPQIGRMICISKGNLESIRCLVEWLKSIHVKGRYLGVVFMRVGETILRRSIEELDEIVLYLESKGVKRDWMGYIMSRCAELLAFSMEIVKIRVNFYTDMGMNEHDFGTMVYDFPKVLGYFSLEEMRQKVNYLKDFGLSDTDVGKLLAFKPQLMACGIEERWKPLLKFLYYLGIDQGGMKRMLVVKPMVFCVDLETTIAPKVRFLQDIGIKDDAIGRMLVKFPPLLTYSLYKKIRPVVVFLLTKAGVTQKNIGKVVALAPELLGCSITRKLDGNVKYFLSLGISVQQLGDMIADFPMLLRYNVELLRPKYRYLRRTMIRPLQDLIEFPRFFSYSLEDRIIPRHKVMVENRVNFNLRYMLPSTDEEFNQRVQAAVERRQRFELGIADLDSVANDKFVETEPQVDSSTYSEASSDTLTANSSDDGTYESEDSYLLLNPS